MQKMSKDQPILNIFYVYESGNLISRENLVLKPKWTPTWND